MNGAKEQIIQQPPAPIKPSEPVKQKISPKEENEAQQAGDAWRVARYSPKGQPSTLR